MKLLALPYVGAVCGLGNDKKTGGVSIPIYLLRRADGISQCTLWPVCFCAFLKEKLGQWLLPLKRHHLKLKMPRRFWMQASKVLALKTIILGLLLGNNKKLHCNVDLSHSYFPKLYVNKGIGSLWHSNFAVSIFMLEQMGIKIYKVLWRSLLILQMDAETGRNTFKSGK